MTTGQEADLVGLRGNLEIHGRPITTSDGQTFLAWVVDVTELPDIVQIAKAKNRIIVTVTAIVFDVRKPQDISGMNEAEYGDLKPLEYIGTRGDALTYQWTCEAQRQ